MLGSPTSGSLMLSLIGWYCAVVTRVAFYALCNEHSSSIKWYCVAGCEVDRKFSCFPALGHPGSVFETMKD